MAPRGVCSSSLDRTGGFFFFCAPGSIQKVNSSPCHPSRALI
ncbi:hypothetical protein CLOSTMETH_00701 [[Clostridium] methylpentosum DSM 5476]|uniref:Uncharacterized protein n=1 Tax=[Clostridium] methylpentosum DSM 5476 TaxID=537013 RepID=C0EA47_9FIRM|nr:hypothetical protein CLOSTMETH_00701 [[Clostridium] methylpentosum DSM 5476]